jgi:hypothetical protein
MCSSTVSFGLISTPAAAIAFSRSSIEMSDFSGLCDRSRHTASVKKLSSGIWSIESALGSALKCLGASTWVPAWSPITSAMVAEEKP